MNRARDGMIKYLHSIDDSELRIVQAFDWWNEGDRCSGRRLCATGMVESVQGTMIKVRTTGAKHS